MNQELKFTSKEELLQFKIDLSEKIVRGEFEIIPTNNQEAKSWSILDSSTFRDIATTEYYKLTSHSGGQWVKVREVLNSEPLLVMSKYLFKSQIGGNFGLVGGVNLKLKQIKKDEELKIDIIFINDTLSRYIRTSVEFGILYAFETMKPYKILEGEYIVEIDYTGFHEIDSSTITMAYAANMALRRAFDLEQSNSMLYESGRFVLYKKYPIHNSFK